MLHFRRSPDPIFERIHQHSVAWQTYLDTLDRPVDNPAIVGARDREAAALQALVVIGPRAVARAAALLLYASSSSAFAPSREMDSECFDWQAVAGNLAAAL